VLNGRRGYVTLATVQYRGGCCLVLNDRGEGRRLDFLCDDNSNGFGNGRRKRL